MEASFITRQAIYNAHREVVGYELLYHDGSTCHATPCSDAEQSAQLIVNTFMGFGLENLVGSNKAFISLSHDFFSHEHPIPMASYQLVLEIPGSCIEDERIYQELRQLSKQGYTFSLYDYEYNEVTAERLDCIDIVKLDIARYDAQQLKEQSRYYRNHGKRLHIKGLETESQQLLCSQLGIDYFQGSLLSPAVTLRSLSSGCNRAVLQAICESGMQDTPGSVTLTGIVAQDAGFSYKLLRYVNCASFAERTEIHTLQQALEIIGSTTIRQWAALLLTAQLQENSNSEPNHRALIRANMCRALAEKKGNTSADEAFLVGLLSTLDEAMGTPLEDLFDSIALTPEIFFALLFGEGVLGHLLLQVKHFEKGEWAQLDTSQLGRDDYDYSYQLALQQPLVGAR